jgi:transposase
LAVQRYLRRYREGRGHAPRTGPKPPTVREVTSWIMRHPDRLNTDVTATLKHILSRDPELNRLADHVRSFAVMMTMLDGGRLEEWIATAQSDTLPALTSFARNLRRDLDAVRRSTWSWR